MFETFQRLPITSDDYYAFRAEFRNEDDNYLNYVLRNGFEDGDQWAYTPKMFSSKNEQAAAKPEQVA